MSTDPNSPDHDRVEDQGVEVVAEIVVRDGQVETRAPRDHVEEQTLAARHEAFLQMPDGDDPTKTLRVAMGLLHDYRLALASRDHPTPEAQDS